MTINLVNLLVTRPLRYSLKYEKYSSIYHESLGWRRSKFTLPTLTSTLKRSTRQKKGWWEGGDVHIRLWFLYSLATRWKHVAWKIWIIFLLDIFYRLSYFSTKETFFNFYFRTGFRHVLLCVRLWEVNCCVILAAPENLRVHRFQIGKIFTAEVFFRYN